MKTKNIVMSVPVMIVLISGVAAAQEISADTLGEDSFLANSFHFFSALVAGTIIALAINLVLTNLAVAAGISIAKPEEAIRPGRKEEKEEAEGGIASTIKKVNNLFGFWTLLAASISLFFGSWFAIEISAADTVVAGVVIALAIWGTFYLVMTAMEARMLTTALGSLFRTAAGAVGTVGKGIKSVFEKSPEAQAADTAEKITEAVRDEIFGKLDTGKLKKELRSWVKQLSPPSARDIKRELADLLGRTELEAIVGKREGGLDVDRIIARFEEESPNKERARSSAHRIREAINAFRQERAGGKEKVQAGIDAALEMTGKSAGEAQHQREELENYLRNTGKAELQPEELERRIELIFKSPREGLRQVGESIAAIDKNTAVAILEQRQDVSHEEALRIADNIQAQLNKIKSVVGSVTGKAGETTSNIENKLRNYMASLEEPQLDYDAIKEELKLLFHDPKAGADALIGRLKTLDRDTLKAIVMSRRDMSEEQAEEIVSKMEETRDDVIAKAEEMKTKVLEKIEQGRYAAAEAAEETRKNVAIAAWWAFGTAVVSGAAAALGAVAAFNT